MLLRREAAALAVEPFGAIGELLAPHHRIDIQRAAVTRQHRPLLEQQHALAGLRQPVGGGRPAGARADDDDVVIHVLSCHGFGGGRSQPPSRNSGYSVIPPSTYSVMPVT